LTIRNAARPTARISIELNRNGTAPPISMPMKTSGCATESLPASARYCAVVMSPMFASLPTAITAMKLAKRLTAAMTAEPMAIPLVSALVVLPTASRSARICRARL
jgi:hypothetical protein